jgi:hypothetical protein
MKITALGNLTPVEASKTEKGREMLKEVLRQIENELARCDEKDSYPFPIEKINGRLGVLYLLNRMELKDMLTSKRALIWDCHVCLCICNVDIIKCHCHNCSYQYCSQYEK